MILENNKIIRSIQEWKKVEENIFEHFYIEKVNNGDDRRTL